METSDGEFMNPSDSHSSLDQKTSIGYEMEEEEEYYFLKFIFPMFRGIGMFFVYQLFLSFNIYSWQKHQMEYRKMFEFKKKRFQPAFKFMKVALIFLIIYVSTMIIYQIAIFIFKLDENEISIFYYSPLLMNTLYLGFLLFPSEKYFMGTSRFFALKKFSKCITFGLVPTVFSVIFITDQMVSFVGPLKDFNYTLCYYIYAKTSEDEYYCKSPKRLSMSIEFALLPYVLRMCQCARQGYDSKNRFWKSSYFYNFLKYLSSVVSILLSYFVQVVHKDLYIFWATAAVTTTVYSYFWDLKMDWNMLDIKEGFRFKPKYGKYSNMTYYSIVVLNLILRFSWIMTITHETIIEHFKDHHLEIFKFITSFLEIFRRYLWNYLRIEKEHVFYLKESKLKIQENYGSIDSISREETRSDIEFMEQSKQ